MRIIAFIMAVMFIRLFGCLLGILHRLSHRFIHHRYGANIRSDSRYFVDIVFLQHAVGHATTRSGFCCWWPLVERIDGQLSISNWTSKAIYMLEPSQAMKLTNNSNFLDSKSHFWNWIGLKVNQMGS